MSTPKAKRRKERRAARQQQISYDQVRAKRAIDPLAALTQRGHLKPVQVTAAKSYRDAFETVSSSSMRGTLGNEGGGGGGHQKTPSEVILIAAQRLAEASAILGQWQGAVVEKIIGRGMTIEECEASMSGGGTRDRRRVSERRRMISELLRDGLDRLANRWHPAGKAGRIRVDRKPDAVPTDTGSTEFGRVNVAHAAPGRVDISKR